MAHDDLKKPPPPPPQAPPPPAQFDAEWNGNFCQCCGSPCTCCPGWGICGLVFCSMGSCLFGLNQKRAFGISGSQAVAWGIGFFMLSTFFGLISFGIDYYQKLKCIDAAAALAQAATATEQETAEAMLRCIGTTSTGSIVLSIVSAVAGLALIGVAGYRRMMIRERFGIKGSVIGDICTWFWCSPCALCQETRTLELKGVREGVWHGNPPPTLPQGVPPASAASAAPPTAASPPLSAPAKEEMSKIV